MKRTFILLIFIFSVSVVLAQKGKVTTALNYKDTGKLDKALEAIEQAVNPNDPKTESSITWPRTWEVRGEIFQAIFQSKDAAVKKLSADPLTEAVNSYKKALELDTKNRFAKSVKIKLTLLNNDLTNQAVDAFNQEDYNKALKSFEQILDVQSLPVIKADNPNLIDTVFIFNAGLAAFNAENYPKAIQYYTEAAKHNYNGGRTYQLLSKSYLENKDTVNAISVLQDAFEKYPTDNGVLVEMINIYLITNKTEEAMKYLEMAIKQDPQNATFYFAQGTLFDRLEKLDAAITSYEKAIEFNKEYFDAYYNLGALYYNQGVKQLDLANKVPANENDRYEAELKKADVWFEKSLPLMEKCNELKPDDSFTLESLKNLYYRLKFIDKYNQILEKLSK